jgi:hypothetical protein
LKLLQEAHRAFAIGESSREATLRAFRILASLFLAPAFAAAVPAQVDGVAPEEIEACLVERVRAEAGREFELFLECCMRLGLDERACREHWASQLPPELPPAPPAAPLPDPDTMP